MTPFLLILSAVSLALAASNDSVLQVTVGDGNLLAYNPSTIFPNVGDILQFIFHPQNHTVTQSTASNPCSPLPGGFFSGFVATTNGTAATSFLVTIHDTNPIYFYSSQGTECQSGMVGVVNPVNISQSTLATAAANVTNSTAPAGGPAGGVLETIATLSNGTSTTLLSTATPMPTSATTASGTTSGSGTRTTSVGVVAGGTGLATTTSGAPASTSSGAAATKRVGVGGSGVMWGVAVGVVGAGWGWEW